MAWMEDFLASAADEDFAPDFVDEERADEAVKTRLAKRGIYVHLQQEEISCITAWTDHLGVNEGL